MKKFISIILILTCAFLLFSCSKDDVVEDDLTQDTIDEINAMYNAIAPTMVKTESTIAFGNHVLENTSTLKKGFVDGYAVTVYDYSRQELRPIADGANADYLDPIVTIVGGWQYHEDNGYREIDEETGDFSEWDYGFEDPTPLPGANILEISKNTVTDFSVDDNVIQFTVTVKNSEKVFGIEATTDVDVTMIHSGADVTSVSFSFLGKVPDKKNYPEAVITIKATYSYEIQEIDLG